MTAPWPRLVGVIRDLHPDVVITSDPHGGYGHPDHIAVHRHTLAAFQAAADPKRFPEQGLAWQSGRLFYGVMTRTSFHELRAQIAASGLDTGEMSRFEEQIVFWPEDQTHVIVDVTDQVAAKLAALECHRTQFGSQHPLRKLSPDVLRAALSREQFALAWPQIEPGQRLPDLFAPLPASRG